MEPVDIERFVSAGYFLIRAGNPGWDQLKTDLLPENLLSLANCISEKLNVGWGWNPGDKPSALQFGICEEMLDEFVEWCQHDYESELGVWSMFNSPEAANRFAAHFLVNFENLHLIGVGLPKGLEEKNWREEPTEGQMICGIEKRIEQRLPLAKGGAPLGFEVISFEYGSFGHSWLCNYLHYEIYKLFGIRTGQYGLLQKEADARQIYEWIEEDDMQGRRAEPVPYDYWLLVDYPLSTDQ